MKIILTNGTELTPIAITGGKRYVQGVNRDALAFVFPASEGFNSLDTLFTAENCESITIEEDGGVAYIHKGYTIRAELVKNPVEVQPATSETEAVYEDRITVTMAQRTYAENQLAAMEAAMTALLKGEE